MNLPAGGFFVSGVVRPMPAGGLSTEATCALSCVLTPPPVLAPVPEASVPDVPVPEAATPDAEPVLLLELHAAAVSRAVAAASPPSACASLCLFICQSPC